MKVLVTTSTLKSVFSSNTPKGATYTCHCCGDKFITAKPQDPDRDKGFGTCDGCRKFVVNETIKHEAWTVDRAEKHFARHA